MENLAAFIFTLVAGALVVFHIGCAAGKPWGFLIQGGNFDGTLPQRGRIFAALYAAWMLLAIIVTRAHAGVLLNAPVFGQHWLIWTVVVFGVLACVACARSENAAQRLLGIPLTLVMVLTSWIVAYFSQPGGSANV